mmetsp:Transcript_29402/g.68170  ORF Transcript_29402/g.68170 Transcript_29402/m.68170 type:complete len:254 (-) Transcript_29402:120-881(-)
MVSNAHSHNVIQIPTPDEVATFPMKTPSPIWPSMWAPGQKASDLGIYESPTNGRQPSKLKEDVGALVVTLDTPSSSSFSHLPSPVWPSPSGRTRFLFAQSPAPSLRTPAPRFPEPTNPYGTKHAQIVIPTTAEMADFSVTTPSPMFSLEKRPSFPRPPHGPPRMSQAIEIPSASEIARFNPSTPSPLWSSPDVPHRQSSDFGVYGSPPPSASSTGIMTEHQAWTPPTAKSLVSPLWNGLQLGTPSGQSAVFWT